MTKLFNIKTGALSALSATLLLAAIMPSMPFASADDTPCVGFLAPGTYENVVAPGPGFCAIGFGVTVTDNVKHTGGSLFISVGATVNGSVESEGGTSLSISGSTINGNVDADGTGSVAIDTSTVTGNVQVKNIAGFVILDGNTITGNVQIEESATTGDFIVVGAPVFGFAGNTITGDLQLIKNAAVTTIVSDNSIFGAVQIEDTSASPGSLIAVGAPAAGIAGNMISGDLQLTKNATDTVVVSDNIIMNGNLQCKDNTAGGVTAFGVPNTVSNGNKEDQCSAALGF